jgi:hypothetical protein
MGVDKLSAHTRRIVEDTKLVLAALRTESDRALPLIGAELISDCVALLLRLEFSLNRVPLREQKS